MNVTHHLRSQIVYYLLGGVDGLPDSFSEPELDDIMKGNAEESKATVQDEYSGSEWRMRSESIQ